MGDLEQFLRALDGAGTTFDTGPRALLASMLAALFIGQLLAWVYSWTHTGLSYSRTFTQSIVLLTLVSALVMYVIGDSVVTAFGLIGALAIIRFRNVLKDTRDTTFILWVMVLGMAVGTMRFGPAIVGCLLVSLVIIYLHVVSFGTRYRYDAVLSLILSKADDADLRPILKRHTTRAELASRRVAGAESVSLSYRVLMRDPDFGSVRLRAFGTYTLKAADPSQLLSELVGAGPSFETDEISELLRAIISTAFADVVAKSEIGLLDLASNYQTLSEQVRRLVGRSIANQRPGKAIDVRMGHGPTDCFFEPRPRQRLPGAFPLPSSPDRITHGVMTPPTGTRFIH